MSESERPVNYAEQVKGKTGLTRIINACGYSKDGLQAACEEQGFRQLLYLNAFLLVLLAVLDLGILFKMVLLGASFLTLIVELFNTAIEAAVDHTSLEKNPLAKRAKDTASAAQTLALLFLAGVWTMALWHEYVSFWF